MPRPKTTLTTSRAKRRSVQIATQQSLKGAEGRYARALSDIARAWGKAYARELEPFIKDRFDAKGDQLPSRFTMLGIRVDAAISRAVGPLFDRMASDVEKANARQMSVIGIEPKRTGLGPLIEERRRENVELLRKAHGDYVDQVRGLLEDPKNFGMRSETLAKELAERANVSESRAELIARDQTLTLNGQITKERQTAAGVEKYTWSTSLDERVRPEHEALEGQVFGWDDPPAVGHPGEDILCRCVAIPLIDELEGLYDEPAADEEKDAIPVPAAPEPEGFSEGVHFASLSVEPGITDETRDEILGSIDDRATLNFLKTESLDRLLLRKDVYYNGKRVDGLYQPRTKELSIATTRPATHTRHRFVPGKVFKMANTGADPINAAKIDLRHELGHHIHDTGGAEVDRIVRQAFLRADVDGRFITQYASWIASEYFAESYAAYLYRPAGLKKYDPNAFEMVETVLQLRGIK